MALDPRVNQPFGRQLQVFTQLLMQKKQQAQEQENKDRDIEIRALTSVVNNPNASPERRAAASQSIDEKLNFSLPQTTAGGLQQREQDATLEELAGKLFLQSGADPESQQEALGTITGEREPGDITPRLAPEREARVGQIEQSEKTSRALQLQREAKTKILKEADKLSKGGKKNKEKAATLLNTLIRVEQTVLENFRRLLETGAGDPTNPPPEVIEAQENLALYAKLGKDILREQGLDVPAKKEHTNSIKALKKQFDGGKLTEEQFRAALLRLEQAGVSRDTILKSMQ